MHSSTTQRRSLWQLAVIGTALALCTATVAGCSRSGGGPAPAAATAPHPSALELLAQLIVKGRAPMTGYTRAQFGAPWTDDNDDVMGHNGCDTRNDILRRDLTTIALSGRSNRCVVQSGRLEDPYTGDTISFLRGAATSSAIQIDHVVALGDAWATGAQRWSPRKRIDLANDPLNLLAVSGPLNQAKGDGDAATWLPPSKAYRCAYVARQVAVKSRYGLAVTPAEHETLAHVLATCPDLRPPQ